MSRVVSFIKYVYPNNSAEEQKRNNVPFFIEKIKQLIDDVKKKQKKVSVKTYEDIATRWGLNATRIDEITALVNPKKVLPK